MKTTSLIKLYKSNFINQTSKIKLQKSNFKNQTSKNQTSPYRHSILFKLLMTTVVSILN